MNWIEAKYGRKSGGRRQLGKNSIYLGRDTKSQLIDKACLNIDAGVISQVGWKGHDRINFFYDLTSRRYWLVRDPKKGNLLQTRKSEAAAARLVLPSDVLHATLLQWFPELKTAECQIRNIECSVAKAGDSHDLIVSDFQVVGK